MSQKNIEYKDAIIKDNSLTYYTFFTFNRLFSNLRFFSALQNSFEANEIIDGIFLGSISSSYDFKILKDKGITHILTVIAGFEPPFPNDFNYLVINALDNENNDLSNVFEETNNFINQCLEDDGKILIHCAAGRSRSATVLMAYLINSFGMDVQHCLLALQNRRNIVQPNNEFLKQLHVYYKTKYIDNA